MVAAFIRRRADEKEYLEVLNESKDAREVAAAAIAIEEEIGMNRTRGNLLSISCGHNG